MGHVLTSTAACQTADAMALEKALCGAGAQVMGSRRRSLDSYDLEYTVRSAAGVDKSVVVSDRALRMRLKSDGLVMA